MGGKCLGLRLDLNLDLVDDCVMMVFGVGGDGDGDGVEKRMMVRRRRRRRVEMMIVIVEASLLVVLVLLMLAVMVDDSDELETTETGEMPFIFRPGRRFPFLIFSFLVQNVIAKESGKERNGMATFGILLDICLIITRAGAR